MTTKEDTLALMVDRMVRAFRPLRIILFGSRARGDSRWDSDYDFLVVMPEGTDCKSTTVAIRRVLADVPASKDVLVTTPSALERRGQVPGSVLRPALREGRALYEQA